MQERLEAGDGIGQFGRFLIGRPNRLGIASTAAIPMLSEQVDIPGYEPRWS